MHPYGTSLHHHHQPAQLAKEGMDWVVVGMHRARPALSSEYSIWSICSAIHRLCVKSESRSPPQCLIFSEIIYMFVSFG